MCWGIKIFRANKRTGGRHEKRVMAFLLAFSLAAGLGQPVTASAAPEAADTAELAEASESMQEVLSKELTELEFEEGIRGAAVYQEKESDNSRATANAVPLGSTIEASLTNNDTRDYFKVTLPATGALTLNMHSELECYTVKVFYGESGEDGVYSDENWWNENLKFVENQHVLYLEKGTYYIRITGTEYNDSDEDYDKYYDYDDFYTGNYTCGVKFTNSNANDVEPNNNFDAAQNLAYGKTVTGQISWNDEVDYYRINVSKIGKVALTITSYMRRYELHLYDKNQEEIWHTDAKWDENAKMRQDTHDLYLEPGIYYIRVRNDDYYYTPGIYKLYAKYTNTNPSFTGDDNSAAKAKAISWNRTYTGQISLNDEYDTYKFTISKTRNIPLTFISYMEYYGLKIYNSAGTTVWNQATKSRKDVYTLALTPGTYYMEVSDGRSYGQYTGTYKFSFSGGNLATLKLNKKSLKLTKGSIYQLKASMSPANVKVSWKTSNAKVVSVSSGKIKAKGYGKATITCTAQDGSKKKASCTVTVVPGKAQVSSVKKSSSGKKVSIKSQNGVTGYEVYTKTKRSSWKLYKTIKGAKNKSFKVKSSYFNSHSFKLRAYKKIGSQKYYGAFSKVL